jgi:hypothetical protein
MGEELFWLENSIPIALLLLMEYGFVFGIWIPIAPLLLPNHWIAVLL